MLTIKIKWSTVKLKLLFERRKKIQEKKNDIETNYSISILIKDNP